MGGCDAGWIRIWLTGFATERTQISATHLADPFPAMISWLESIVQGADCAAWSIAEEGRVSRLLFVGDVPLFDRGSDRLVLLRDWGEECLLKQVAVERMTLVAQFYGALRGFCRNGYVPDQWEWNRHLAEWEKGLSEEEWNALATLPDNPWHGTALRELRSLLIEAALGVANGPIALDPGGDVKR